MDAGRLDNDRVVAVTDDVEHERLTVLACNVENDFGTTSNSDLQPPPVEESNYRNDDAGDCRDDEEVLKKLHLDQQHHKAQNLTPDSGCSPPRFHPTITAS